MSLSRGRVTGGRCALRARCLPLLLSLLALLLAGPAARADAILPAQRVLLANGMQILLHEDHRTPFVAVSLGYRAGAAYERAEDAGLSHLVLHLLQGRTQHTAPWPPALHLAGAGAVGVTYQHEPAIRFGAILPSANLETALWLQSDGMGFLLPAVTDALVAHAAQQITQEREATVATEPYFRARQEAWAALLPPAHPLLRTQVTPSWQLLRMATVKAFFQRTFAPSNATLVLAGDFDTAAVLPRLQRYFGTLPSPPRPPVLPVPRAELPREVVLRRDEPLGRLPLLEVRYLVPGPLSDGGAAASLLAAILSRGREGRLDRALLTDPRLAVRVESAVVPLPDQAVLTLSVFAEQEPQLERSLAAIDQVLSDIAEHGVSAEELVAVRRHHRSALILSLHEIEQKARRLQQHADLADPSRGIERELEPIDKVRSQDLQELVRASCRPSQRVVLFATPASQTQVIQR